MAMNFPKGQRAIAFDRATAFPLDANAYFESLVDAKAAVKSAEAAGSKLTTYYFGQQIAVVENDKATLYIIEKTTVGEDVDARGYEGQLKEVGSKTLGDEASIVLDADGVLSIYGFADAKDKCVPYKDTKTGKLIWGTVEGLIPDAVVPVGDGETVIVSADPDDNTKRIVSLLGKDNAADKAVLRKHIDSESNKVTYTWDIIYDQDELNTLLDKKVDKSTVAAIDGRVTTLEGQIEGLTGAMHFKGVVEGEELPSDFSSYAAGDVVLFDTKEYVCVETVDGKAWRELGDEGSHLTKTEAASTYLTKVDAEKTYTTNDDMSTALAKKVDAVEGKGLSTNDYDAAAVAEVAKIANKVDTDTFNAAIEGKQDVNANLTGIAGMAAEGAGLIKKTADGYAYDTNEYITDAALTDYAKSADVAAEINAAVADKLTEEQVDKRIETASIKGSQITGAVPTATLANSLAGTLSFGQKTFDGSTDTTLTAADLGAMTAIPVATESALGGISIGYQPAVDAENPENNENTLTHLAVLLNAENKAYVKLPNAFLVAANGGLEQDDTGIKIKEVSTDKLVQGNMVLILNGGSADDNIE